MKISIVTISYNQARFLEQAICSVINQDYPDKEYIVVDPGSTDGSREIIERYRDRIDKIIFEPDEGPADGLNKGFAQATGEIFGFINSDDALLPGALSRVARAFAENPEVDVILGYVYQVDGNGRLIKRIRTGKINPKRFVYGGVNFAQQGMFFRAHVFRRVGGFNIKNTTSWDGELALDMALSGARFAVLDEYIAIFRLHDRSASKSSDMDRMKRVVENHERCFVKAMGRNRRAIDKIVRQLFRFDKWRRDPVGLVIRLYDMLILSLRPRYIEIRSLLDG